MFLGACAVYVTTLYPSVPGGDAGELIAVASRLEVAHPPGYPLYTLLDPLPPGTLLLTRGDLVTNAVRYLQVCEGVRPDVVVLDQELMTKPWYVERARREVPAVRFPGPVYDPNRPPGFSMRSFVAANEAAFPIAVYPEWKSGDRSVESVYELWPMGLALRVAPLASPPSLQAWERDSDAGLQTLDRHAWPPLDAYPAGTWEHVVLDDVWQAHHRRGWWLLTKALANGGDARLLADARATLEAAERARPDAPWFVYRNLGIVYERLAVAAPELRERQIASWRRYLELAPPDDAGRAAIANAVEQLDGRRGADRR